MGLSLRLDLNPVKIILAQTLSFAVSSLAGVSLNSSNHDHGDNVIYATPGCVIWRVPRVQR